MVVAGAGLLLCGASPELSEKGLLFCTGIDWKAVTLGIIRAAECSRWFFTVVQATRDFNKRWPG
jgi:hypothetical protein